MPWILQSDVKAIRRISDTFNADRFNSFAQAAQDENLRVWLGDSLYLDMDTNLTDAKYQTLLNGESYLKDGKTIKFFGLKQYLCYSWLFINTVEGDDFQANVGTVNFGQTASMQFPKSKSATMAKYSDSMSIYKNNAIDYLNEKSSTYPLWESTEKSKGSSFRFIRI